MKQFKTILGISVLLVGGFVLYKILPAYWNHYQVTRMITDQAVLFTNFPKSEDEMRNTIAEKAQDMDVVIAPEQIAVVRHRGDVSISFAYTVHIDMPGYPFDLNFEPSTTNQNVMK